MDVQILPHVNASLNAVATLLLLIGYWQIRTKREQATSGPCWPALSFPYFSW